MKRRENTIFSLRFLDVGLKMDVCSIREMEMPRQIDDALESLRYSLQAHTKFGLHAAHLI